MTHVSDDEPDIKSDILLILNQSCVQHVLLFLFYWLVNSQIDKTQFFYFTPKKI